MKKKKSTKKIKKANGRPPILIDWQLVDKMLMYQGSGEYISFVLNISYDTLQRACKKERNLTFAELSAQKKQTGLDMLRNKMYTTAIEGNVTMMRYLSKNWLVLSDSPKEDRASKIDLRLSYNLEEQPPEQDKDNES